MTGAVIALSAVAGLAACGGPDAAQVRSEVTRACTVHTRALPADTAGAVPSTDRLLTALSAFNATDAALDAIGADGSDGDAVDRMRQGLLAARTGFAAAYQAADSGDVSRLASARIRADDGYRRVAAAAAALDVTGCAPDSLGRPLLRRSIAALQAAARRTAPTGDFRTDLARACRGLPANGALVAADPADPRSQGVAMNMNERLVAFRAALNDMTPSAPDGPAFRAVLRALTELDSLLASYVEAVGVSDAGGAADIARQVSGVLLGVRHRLTSLGVRC